MSTGPQEKFIIASGNPQDGFSYTGPFDTYGAALEYAEDFGEALEKDWWIVTLNEP